MIPSYTVLWIVGLERSVLSWSVGFVIGGEGARHCYSQILNCCVNSYSDLLAKSAQRHPRLHIHKIPPFVRKAGWFRTVLEYKTSHAWRDTGKCPRANYYSTRALQSYGSYQFIEWLDQPNPTLSITRKNHKHTILLRYDTKTPTGPPTSLMHRMSLETLPSHSGMGGCSTCSSFSTADCGR